MVSCTTKLLPQAKTLEEEQELIKALWAVAGIQAKQIEEQARQIAELTSKVIELTEKVRSLEEKLNTNSTNSSKPPPADINKDKTTKKSSGRKAGGQPSRIGKARDMLYRWFFAEIFFINIRCARAPKSCPLA